MRPCARAVLAVATLAATLGSTVTAGHDLSAWFFGATAAESSGTASATIEPDFLPGKSMSSMHCGGTGVAIGGGIWQLVKFDQTHGIGLAVASTDQCSVSLFKASPPGVTVPDADLSALSTGRGLHVGSTYADVLAAYGGKRMTQSGRFVVTYASSVAGTGIAHPNKKIDNPETITLVIDNDRVSAITVSVDLSGEF
jgi:hypothetical protein